MRIIHLSAHSRAEGVAGGVELFAHLLQKAIGCEIHTTLPSGLDPKQTIVIADFHHSMRVPTDISVVCFIHGSMAELAKRVDKEADFRGVIQRQHEACHRPNTLYVAASASARHFAQLHHGLTEPCLVIPHGVEPEVFGPEALSPQAPPWVVLHAANSYVKRGEFIPEIAAALEEQAPGLFRIEYLDAPLDQTAAAYRRGRIFVHPSNYEGNSYACLEAAMSGLPLVVSASGLFDTPMEPGRHPFGLVLAQGLSAAAYALAIITVTAAFAAHPNNVRPRDWALTHGNYHEFARAWNALVTSMG